MKSEKESPAAHRHAPIRAAFNVRKDTNLSFDWKGIGIELENDWRRNGTEF